MVDLTKVTELYNIHNLDVIMYSKKVEVSHGRPLYNSYKLAKIQVHGRFTATLPFKKVELLAI